jgi:hypothetical protein
VLHSTALVQLNEHPNCWRCGPRRRENFHWKHGSCLTAGQIRLHKFAFWKTKPNCPANVLLTILLASLLNPCLSPAPRSQGRCWQWTVQFCFPDSCVLQTAGVRNTKKKRDRERVCARKMLHWRLLQQQWCCELEWAKSRSGSCACLHLVRHLHCFSGA